MSEIDIILITRDTCQYCNLAKAFLLENNIEFSEQLIGRDITREAVLLAYPDSKLLPIFTINGIAVGSYLELMDYVNPPKFKKDEIKLSLKKSRCLIVYQKVNNELNVRRGTLNFDFITSGNEPDGNNNFVDYDKTVRYFDITANAWRSFRIDKLKVIKELK